MLPVLGFTLASMIAVLALNTFVMTTLDTAVRITRFIVQESVGQRVPVFLNKYVTTASVVLVAYWIGATGGWQKIWPIFGATNQLIAAVALFVIATYLIGVRRPTQYALYPAVFMVITTIGALSWQAYRFFTAPEPNLFLGMTALLLIGLALFVGHEGLQALKSRKIGPEPAPSEA
jgi:carbon starvation protein